MTQLDLFGEVLAAERQQLAAGRQRSVEALTCLRDSVPTALEVVATLRYQRTHDTTTPCAGGDWAYCVCKRGLRFQAITEWQGWNHLPAHLLTWDELAALVGNDPRRAEITAWMDALPQPRWQPLSRPHELWPNPEQWHPDRITSDHRHPRWPARLRAWQLTLELLTDAINQLSPTAVPQ
ncbi:hypothetical protein [Nocardia asiatica]|uniref:hypothetical protein n=1 Tax=Nocardia asiatica TaxID=209252 RepID=UPI0002E2D04A|nr:hypothetical protein [Nocardia asiatica]